MPDLILRPSNTVPGKPWALQLRFHESPGETRYITLARVTEELAWQIIAAGPPFWLFGEPKENPDVP